MSPTISAQLRVLVAIVLVAFCAFVIVLLIQPKGAPATSTTALPPTDAVPSRPSSTIDDSWSKVQASGRLVVGTAPSHPPFAYYVGASRIDGFDIALMDEIGRRLGVQIAYRDYAFDGLENALALHEIDAAIAAISMTAEREASIDFSDVYLVSQAAILARQDSTLSVKSVSDLAPYKIGVRRGTTYERLLQASMVDTDMMPNDQVFAYEQIQDAIRDLQDLRLDLVMHDSLPAALAAEAGDVKLVTEGLDQQQLAVALPKGSTALRDQIDRVLLQLDQEGFIAAMVWSYMGTSGLLPTPSPASTSTPAAPVGCLDDLTFLSHGEAQPIAIQPGMAFVKLWTVMNTGTCTWNSDYRLVFADGNKDASRMGGQPTSVQEPVAPGQTYQFQVLLVAPLTPDAYRIRWRMENNLGKAFGERLQASVFVPSAATVTPSPTQTPVPGIVFTVDRSQIRAGECVDFYWKVDHSPEVFFYSDGERWQERGVAVEATRTECPPTTTYYLRVVKSDTSVEVRQITINVEPETGAPDITRFTVDPASKITLDQCVVLRWDGKGRISQVTITANDAVLWDRAPTTGMIQHCPSAVGSASYGLEVEGPDGVSRGQQTIQVVDPAEATPAPTEVPDLPIITAFSVTPAQIRLGQCVGITWSTSGGTSLVQLLANGLVVLDHAPIRGSAQDCPLVDGQSVYRLHVSNTAGATVTQEAVVLVDQQASGDALEQAACLIAGLR